MSSQRLELGEPHLDGLHLGLHGARTACPDLVRALSRPLRSGHDLPERPAKPTLHPAAALDDAPGEVPDDATRVHFQQSFGELARGVTRAILGSALVAKPVCDPEPR